MCTICGKETEHNEGYCPHCGARLDYQCRSARSRFAYILLALFLGAFGVHNSYAGYYGRGITQLLITLLLGWAVVPLVLVYIWVLFEIIMVEEDANGCSFND